MKILPIDKAIAKKIAIARHYLHRAPPISFSFGLIHDNEIAGILTFGTPASRHMQKSVVPSDPSLAIELNRLWLADELPRNTASFFISCCLRRLPPFVVASYADTAQGHFGWVYRAANFRYAGWTDMERKTPRFDYVTPGMHSRQTTRTGNLESCERVRRKPKVKYWTTTGANRRERRAMANLCGWPSLDWRETPPPGYPSI